MPEKFDAIAAWNKLTAEQQREIGVAAIIYAIGELAQFDGGVEPCQGFESAAHHGRSALYDTVEEKVLAGSKMQAPDLAALGVRACRVCGCTDECACPEGCEWVETDLCSGCVSYD